MAVLKVHEVMTRQVVTVGPDAGYKEIVDTLVDAGVSAVPVVDEGRVVGVASEADLLHRVELASDAGHARLFERRRQRDARTKAAGDTAAELMTSPALTIGPDASVIEAARLMEAERIKRIPVVDGQGRLVGIVSRRDLLRGYLRPDDDIRAEISTEVLRHTLFIDPDIIDVAVVDGLVTLSGKVDRRSMAGIIGRLVRGVTGVVDVRNHLAYDYDDTRDLHRGYTFDAEV